MTWSICARNQVSTLQEQFKKTQEIYNQDIPSTAELLEQAAGDTKPTVGSKTAAATKPTANITQPLGMAGIN